MLESRCATALGHSHFEYFDNSVVNKHSKQSLIYPMKEVCAMSSRSRVFASSADLVSFLGVPWREASPVLTASGSWTGFQSGTGRPSFINPQGSIANTDTTSGNWNVVADIHHGKGTFTKCLAQEFTCMQAGVENGEPVDTRMRYNDYKLEKGKGEWGQIAKWQMRDTVTLAAVSRLNPFDPAFGASQIENTLLLILMLQHSKRGPLDAMESLRAQIAMDMIYKLNVRPGLPLIEQFVHTITKSEIIGYLTSGHEKLKHEYAKDMQENAAFAEKLNLNMQVTPALISNDVAYSDFERAGVRVALYLNDILNTGRYGQTFGGDSSLYDILCDKYVHLDWVGMPPEASDLLQVILEFVDTVTGRQDEGNTLITPHHNFSDEQSSEMKWELRAQIKEERQRKKRSVHTVTYDNYQYMTDLLKLGAPNSSLRSHGEAMFKSTGLWIIGGQPEDDDTLDAIVKAGATDAEAVRIARQTQGQWAFVHPRRKLPTEFIDHVVLPSQRNLIDTKGASRRVAERMHVTASSVYQERYQRLIDAGVDLEEVA